MVCLPETLTARRGPWLLTDAADASADASGSSPESPTIAEGGA